MHPKSDPSPTRTLGAALTLRSVLEALYANRHPDQHAILMALPNMPPPRRAKSDNTPTPPEPEGGYGTGWLGNPWMGGDPERPRRWPDDTSKANVYTSISTFTMNYRGERRRLKACFGEAHALMIDDIGTKVPMERGLVLPPSYLVETSPGNYQSWLFLTGATDIDRFDVVMAALIKQGLSQENDPGMSGVSRVGRPPFGWNNKPKYIEALGHPWQVRLAEGIVDRAWAPERRYRLEDVVAAYGLDLKAIEAEVRAYKARAAGHMTEADKVGLDLQFRALVDAAEMLGWYRSRNQRTPGWHNVWCPWTEHHTGQDDSGAAISTPSEKNNWAGGFKCHHGGCAKRTLADFRRAVTDEITRRLMVIQGQRAVAQTGESA